MGAYRQLMDEARGKLHEFMSFPVLYYPWPLGGTIPRVVTIRYYEKGTSIGALKGTSFHFAERLDDSPCAQFLRAEIEPQQGFRISHPDGRVFFLDSAYTPDGITTLMALKPDKRTEGKPYPRAESNFIGGNISFPTFGSV